MSLEIEYNFQAEITATIDPDKQEINFPDWGILTFAQLDGAPTEWKVASNGDRDILSIFGSLRCNYNIEFTRELNKNDQITLNKQSGYAFYSTFDNFIRRHAGVPYIVKNNTESFIIDGLKNRYEAICPVGSRLVTVVISTAPHYPTEGFELQYKGTGEFHLASEEERVAYAKNKALQQEHNMRKHMINRKFSKQASILTVGEGLNLIWLKADFLPIRYNYIFLKIYGI